MSADPELRRPAKFGAARTGGASGRLGAGTGRPRAAPSAGRPPPPRVPAASRWARRRPGRSRGREQEGGPHRTVCFPVPRTVVRHRGGGRRLRAGCAGIARVCGKGGAERRDPGSRVPGTPRAEQGADRRGSSGGWEAACPGAAGPQAEPRARRKRAWAEFL